MVRVVAHDGAVDGAGRFGLAEQVRGCLFDLDGVLTRTAVVHAAAWKETFDALLRERTGDDFRPFDDDDYARYVDGKRREDGVRDFLTSRDIVLDEGDHDDPPGAQTVFGVGNRKNEVLQRRIREDGVELYDDSVDYVRAVRGAGLSTAVVSSSANTHEVLQVTGIADLFQVVVDAHVVRDRGLRGKPAPDGFLEGARELGLGPDECAVFEDALAGVEAGRTGAFATVIGVDRVGQAEALREHGADRVVADLGELL